MLRLKLVDVLSGDRAIKDQGDECHGGHGVEERKQPSEFRIMRWPAFYVTEGNEVIELHFGCHGALKKRCCSY